MGGLEPLELAEEPVVLGIRDLGRVIDVVGGAVDLLARRATCSVGDMAGITSSDCERAQREAIPQLRA